mmetsp:Transcript_22221/g.46878  ORF Transcript_22221/g.46878 Transcript_22221/m.46878 type:complete len:168 (-) Transcript_22221:42-545(-)
MILLVINQHQDNYFYFCISVISVPPMSQNKIHMQLRIKLVFLQTPNSAYPQREAIETQLYLLRLCTNKRPLETTKHDAATAVATVKRRIHGFVTSSSFRMSSTFPFFPRFEITVTVRDFPSSLLPNGPSSISITLSCSSLFSCSTTNWPQAPAMSAPIVRRIEQKDP